MSKNTHTKLFKLQFSGASGNNPTPLKTPDFKGFYSSRFAIDSNMTAKNIEDALLFTAEHLFIGAFRRNKSPGSTRGDKKDYEK